MRIQFCNNKDLLPTSCLSHGHKDHNCSTCVYWLLQDKQFFSVSLEEKQKIKQAYLKYAESEGFGYILACDGKDVVGLLQFGPVSVYKRSLDYGADITDVSKWRIVCLQANNNSSDIKQKLLASAIDHIKKNVKNVKHLISAPHKDRTVEGICSVGSAEDFLAVGFQNVEDLKNDFVLVSLSL